MNTKQAQFETLRSIANGSITGSFAVLGTPLLYSARILSIVNTCDQDMLFSTDGTNAMFIVPKTSYKIYDLGTNRLETDESFYFAAHTQFYIKYVSAPGSGSVYLEVIYGLNTVAYSEAI